MPEELLYDGPESMLPRLDDQAVWRALAPIPPRTGHCVDTLRPGDLRLAPPQARAELAMVFWFSKGSWDVAVATAHGSYCFVP